MVILKHKNVLHCESIVAETSLGLWLIYKHVLFYEDKEAYVDVSKQKLVEQGDMDAIMSAFKDAGYPIL